MLAMAVTRSGVWTNGHGSGWQSRSLASRLFRSPRPAPCGVFANGGYQKRAKIAEYAVMLAAFLVLVMRTIRLIGGSEKNVFSPPLVRKGTLSIWRNTTIFITLHDRFGRAAFPDSSSQE